jgi:hypothetical protein
MRYTALGVMDRSRAGDRSYRIYPVPTDREIMGTSSFGRPTEELADQTRLTCGLLQAAQLTARRWLRFVMFCWCVRNGPEMRHVCSVNAIEPFFVNKRELYPPKSCYC